MRDCQNCRFHVQALVSDHCDACLSQSRAGNPVPLWQAEVEHEIDVPEGSFTKQNPEVKSAFAVQVGGDHYKVMQIQPVEFATANKLDFFQKDILKYITRRKGDKAKRLEDLGKARHYLDMYIEAIAQGNWE